MRFRHTPSYWKSEAFASMFAALADPADAKRMRALFPNTWAVFMDYIDQLVQLVENAASGN